MLMTWVSRIIAVILFFLTPDAVPATTWYVDASVATSGNGLSWDEAFLTISEAIAPAGDGDTIVVAPGIYREGVLAVRSSVTVRSTNANDADTVAATVIEDTTIQAAYVFLGFTIRGRGVLCGSETVAIANNIICDGGGISCTGSSAVISGNRVLNNFTSWGGGIYCDFSSVTIVNNIIARNTAASLGGAIYCQRSSPLIQNNTIVGNTAGGKTAELNAGGIYCDEGSHPTIKNCILWDNGDDLFNCSATYSCIQDADLGQGNIAFYPHFADAEGDDYSLNSWSPCIDAGDPSSDFSLEPQPNGGRVNMGAFGNTPKATSRSPDADADGLPDDWETLHFGAMRYKGRDDPDGDAIVNADEYWFGWNPTVASAAPVRNITAKRGYRTVFTAIVGASSGDEIVAAPAYYIENIHFLGKGVTLRSTNPLDPNIVAATMLLGADSGTVVRFIAGENNDAVISGFTITGGRALRGGGIYCLNSSPTILSNVIIGNHPGGGVYCEGGSPVLRGNRVEKNLSTYAAGMYFEGGAPTISDNIIERNWGKRGAGICLRGCVAATIERNAIIGNYGFLGGGVFLDASRALLRNNLIAANRANERGGGVYHFEGKAIIVNNTVVANLGEYVGGIYRENGMATGPVTNCVIWGNGDDLHGVEASYSCIEDDDAGEGNIHLDPQFVDPEGADYRVGANSPCRNTGNTVAALEVTLSLVDDGALISWFAGDDLDGNPRISGAAADIGAYEYQEGPPSLGFILEYSSDLTFWESIDVGSAWQWLDDMPDGLGSRFYRIGVR